MSQLVPIALTIHHDIETLNPLSFFYFFIFYSNNGKLIQLLKYRLISEHRMRISRGIKYIYHYLIHTSNITKKMANQTKEVIV
jgi:hypothetical protein